MTSPTPPPHQQPLGYSLVISPLYLPPPSHLVSSSSSSSSSSGGGGSGYVGKGQVRERLSQEEMDVAFILGDLGKGRKRLAVPSVSPDLEGEEDEDCEAAFKRVRPAHLL